MPSPMHLVLVASVGLWLLLWAIVIGYALLSRLDGTRRPLTLFDDRPTYLFEQPKSGITP